MSHYSKWHLRKLNSLRPIQTVTQTNKLFIAIPSMCLLNIAIIYYTRVRTYCGVIRSKYRWDLCMYVFENLNDKAYYTERRSLRVRAFIIGFRPLQLSVARYSHCASELLVRFIQTHVNQVCRHGLINGIK